MNQIPARPEDTARRFPLVSRPAPLCHPLEVRVRQITDLADAGHRGGSIEAVTSAAQALNFAALVASDCGLPDLAHQLCARQFRIFHDARPFDAATVKLALQPLINLGRLHTRAGDGATGHRLIDMLYTAVHFRQAVQIEGISADFDGLVRAPEDHREVTQWLWTVLLADGTRALAQAGRWDQALQHLHDRKGIGPGLLDGRQIGIIAHHALGDGRTAAHLLDTARTPTPWEAAVAAALGSLTGRDVPNSTLTDSFLALNDSEPRRVLFRTRLGLAMHDHADGEPDRRLAVAIEADVLRARDAYAAREVLIRPGVSGISSFARTILNRLLDASGLGRGTIPSRLLDEMTAAIGEAETSLAVALVAGGRVRSTGESG